MLKTIKYISIFIVLSWAAASSAAQAATPRDWWVDIANDRAQDVETMLHRGVDPNAISPNGQPSLMYAIRNGAWHVYDVLLADPGTKVNITNSHDETPLMYLAVVGQSTRALALIQRGADVNRLGWTPLHYAASTGKVATAKMLIAQKAIVNAPSPDGTTPLMMAAYSGSRAMVQLLLDAGADPTTRNLEGKSAADWARRQGFTDLAKQLDAIAQKVTARRKAQRAEDIANQAQTLPVTNGAATGAAGVGGAMPGTASPATNGAQPADGIVGNGGRDAEGASSPSQALPSPASGDGSEPDASSAPADVSGGGVGSSGNGTSRYFNLQGAGVQGH